MKRIHYIQDVPNKPGSKVTIGGRVSRISDLKNARFIWIRDMTGTIQVTALKDKLEKSLLKNIIELSNNDFVLVEGTVPDQIKAKFGLEIVPNKVEVVGKALEPSPIDFEGALESSFDKRLDWRALDLRSAKQTGLFRIQSRILEGFRKYFYSQEFMEVFTPSLMGMSSEGGAEVFELEHFGKKAYLRQDPQFHRQLLMVAGFEKVYEIGPSWRAELSNTPRHLTEHRTCAAEISFIEDERDVMRVEEQAVVSAIKNVVEKCGKELELFGIKLDVPKTPFPELKFPDIYDTLKELGVKLEKGKDLNRDAEEALGKYVKEKFKSDFFFVNRFPFSAKPFYVMKVDEDPTWARSVDLMYKGLEMSSGGQREHRYDKIISQAKEKGLELSNLKWFTDFFKYGAPPHGGFSLGIERFTMQVANMSNVRETTLFPRYPDRLVP